MKNIKSIIIFILIFIFTFTIPAISKSIQPVNYPDILENVYQEYKDLDYGNNADYIPELAKVPSDLFGITLVTVDGNSYDSGDTQYKFSIQSVSKVFTLAKVMDNIGSKAIFEKIGAKATGRPFNSIIAIEDMGGSPSNPLVNAGAIATTSLISGKSKEEKWQSIISTFQQFAGNDLEVNQPVYKSESETNQRNQAIAKLLESYGKIYASPVETVDLYTRQCAVNVSAHDLGVMAATLANGGVNPITGNKVVNCSVVPHVLAVMATAGMYDESGPWLYSVGLPGKSGVGGGIIAVAPGKYGIAAFSPRLNKSGNSIKAIMAIKAITKKLKSNIFLKN